MDKMLKVLLISAAIVALAFAVSPVWANPDETPPPTTLVSKHKGTTIRLFDRPCVSDFVHTVAPDYAKLMKQGEADFSYIDGRPNEVHAGCWMEMNSPDGPAIVTIWDDGDAMVFARKLFAPEGV